MSFQQIFLVTNGATVTALLILRATQTPSKLSLGVATSFGCFAPRYLLAPDE